MKCCVNCKHLVEVMGEAYVCPLIGRQIRFPNLSGRFCDQHEEKEEK